MADRGLAVSLFLALRLKRPLFVEGEAGVGKTALAGAMAAALGTDLIRLQCYEGLDVSHALYEWDYARQLLELRILDAAHSLDRASARRELYSEAFLIKRPLLQAIDPLRTRPAVLLIDEIDRADEEFEGFLLELLAEFQITIPELGTVRAVEPPLVILTSNRTREVHDALKRRCLYQWIDYPSLEKELAIVRRRVPEAPVELAERVTAMAQELRSLDLYKVPGVSETIDWVAALVALDRETLDPEADRRHARRRPESQRGSRVAPRPPRCRIVRARDRSHRITRVTPRTSHLADNLLVFGRILRRAGVPVHPGRLLDLLEALAHVNLADRDEVYHACRTLLVHRKDQIAIFDAAFAAFWRAHDRGQPRIEGTTRSSRSHVSVVDIEEVLASDVTRAGTGARRCGGRRRRDAGARSEDLEQPGRSRQQGLRRLHDERTPGGACRAGAARLVSGRTPHAAVGSWSGRARGSSARDRREPPYRR